MEKEKNAARVHGFVSGRVQGVFFRAFVQSEARSLGLSGFVRNVPDGRVEFAAEGSRERLEALLERLRTGPPAADVRAVSLEWGTVEGEFDGFEIDHG